MEKVNILIFKTALDSDAEGTQLNKGFDTTLYSMCVIVNKDGMTIKYV